MREIALVAGKLLIVFLLLFGSLSFAQALGDWFRRDHSEPLPDTKGWTTGSSVERYYDTEERVTCWIVRHPEGPAISCLRSPPIDCTKIER